MGSEEQPVADGDTRNTEVKDNRVSAACASGERRRDRRHHIRFGASYANPSNGECTHAEFVGCCAIDVSRKGLSLFVDDPVPVPAVLCVQLYLPGLYFGSAARCRSVHCSTDSQTGMYRLGLEFVDYVPTDLRQLINEI